MQAASTHKLPHRTAKLAASLPELLESRVAQDCITCSCSENSTTTWDLQQETAHNRSLQRAKDTQKQPHCLFTTIKAADCSVHTHWQHCCYSCSPAVQNLKATLLPSTWRRRSRLRPREPADTETPWSYSSRRSLERNTICTSCCCCRGTLRLHHYFPI